MLAAWGVKLDDQKKAKDIQPKKLYAVTKKNEVSGKYTQQHSFKDMA